MRVLKFIITNAMPYRLYLYGMILAMILITLDNAIKPILVKFLIDTASGEANHNIWQVCLVYVVLQSILVGSWTLSDYCAMHFNNKFRLDILEFFMKRLYTFPYSFFQNQMLGNVTSKIEDVFKALSNLVFTAIVQFGYIIFLVLISSVILWVIHPIFSISLIVWVIIFCFFTFRAMRDVIPLSQNYAEAKANIIAQVSDYISNILNVKIFCGKDFEIDRFNKYRTEYNQVGLKQGFHLMYFYTKGGVFTSVYALFFLFALIIGKKQNLVSSGDFAIVFMTNFNIISTLYQLSNSLKESITNFSAVDQALAMFDTQPRTDNNSNVLTVTKGEIIFEQVDFNYSAADILFDNKSVVIMPGQKLGLVGYSGGGKSSFVNLILRLYEVNSGKILIDGQDIKNVSQESLRSSIAMISQEPTLFNRSILENIRYGKRSATDKEVIDAAKKAHAHHFIMKLPEGYNSLVGERSLKLSGGQKQRIAIARAILKNAPILILDEATSQLDSITESYIQESLWHLMQGKTSIVIAHRLSTLLYMDRILVFDQGKIIEDGSHIELISKNGIYKTLWDTQVGGFIVDGKSQEL